jgi:AraC-like DNA-binding protein
VVVFRAEVLPPRAEAVGLTRELDALPTHVRVPRQSRPAVDETLARMARDAEGEASRTRNRLLTTQLAALLLRLRLAALPAAAPMDRAELERFHRFRAAVEKEHRRWHLVKQYAKHLGCSPKSLHRAARLGSNTTAKAFIADRVVLEAKRRLVHTDDPVYAIADDLGFEEPTNFVKFFRQRAGITPGAFRRQQATG